jgi:bacteriorhodopsin
MIQALKSVFYSVGTLIMWNVLYAIVPRFGRMWSHRRDKISCIFQFSCTMVLLKSFSTPFQISVAEFILNECYRRVRETVKLQVKSHKVPAYTGQ